MGYDRHGLDQAQANATWLSGKLTDLNGCAVPVTPVLVLPGWWVDRKGKSSISVLNAKECANFFKGRPPTLSAERQRAIANQLEERCRIDSLSAVLIRIPTRNPMARTQIPTLYRRKATFSECRQA